MNKERALILETYIKSNISPILLENIPAKCFEDAIILDSNCDISLLNGHYEDIDFVAPNWYNKLLENSKKGNSILIIDNINSIPKDEQTKFIEILKYKKISTFDLPKNCFIIVTANNLKENPINKEVYSLLVQI